MEAQLRELMVVLPVKVSADYDPSAKPATVKLQPTIQMRRQKANGEVINQSLPEIPKALVHFGGGGGFALTHPVKKGDEGLMLVSSRCLEGWMQRGDVQPQDHVRYHDLTDAVFLPGVRSKPRALANVSSDTVQLRSEDGNSFIELGSSTVKIKFGDGGEFIFHSDGKFTATGNVVAGQGTGDQISVQDHKHAGVQTGGNQTQKPVAGT